MMNKFAFTCGDVNGIGPEITIKTLNAIKSVPSKYYLFCPATVFRKLIVTQKINFNYEIVDSFYKANPSRKIISVVNITNKKQQFGIPTKYSGKTAYDAISTAVELTKNKHIDAIITAPISKTAIKLAGINFPGHTEMLAEWAGQKKFVMMFLSNKINAALLTIHEPLKKIPELITKKRIHNVLDTVIDSLKNDLKIKRPKIAVLGLNPHAGEGGLIGKEEENIIIPALKSYPGKKILSGPFPPDAFFANQLYQKYDLVLGMYHDQALIPFKLINFGKGVNYTAGLPIIRTSPDHGVAYDIAGKNIADPSSMIEAFKYAKKIIANRLKNAES